MDDDQSEVEILILHAGDEAILSDVAPGVFDRAVQPRLAAEFLRDPRHHLAVAREAGHVIGCSSAVHYVHPDKPPELWINEINVAPSHRLRGVAKRLLRALFQAGRIAGCRHAWVLTDRANPSAVRLYRSLDGIEANEQTVMFEFSLDEPGESSDFPVARSAGVRAMRADERPVVVEMMTALWPEGGDYDFGDEMVLVWERPDGRLGGFVSFSLRPWAEGCDSAPVPYLEGWWVEPDLRNRGVGRALIEEVERWCRQHGYHELGSDTELTNTASREAHAALGFQPTMQLQFFRKQLG